MDNVLQTMQRNTNTPYDANSVKAIRIFQAKI